MTMSELARTAAEEQMIANAPIQAAFSVRIAAPRDRVWNVLTNVSDWEHWYPYLKHARLEGSFTQGSKLTYGGLIKHKLRIAKVHHGRLVMLYGTMAGYKGITRWDLHAAKQNVTEVSFIESSAGFLIGTFYSNQKLVDHLQHWLSALKAEAERLHESSR